MKKIYLFAAIFALVAGVATFFFAKSLSNTAKEDSVESANVVIALQDIEPDTVVSPDMFETVNLPVSAITYGTLVNADDVNGYVAAEKISKGEQVLAAKLIKVGEKTNLRETKGDYRLSYHLEKGNYAYTFAVSDVNSVAYFVRRGDYINAYAGDEEEPVVKNVRVLEVGTYSDHKLMSAGTPVDAYALLTVSVTEEQIHQLMEYGEVSHIVLVPYAEGVGIEDEVTDAEGNAADKAKDEKEDDSEIDAPETNYASGEITTPAEESEK